MESLVLKPIKYRGVSHSSAKHYTDSTHRLCSPEDTLEKVRPYFNKAGLTRLSDITGLDRIGIPTIAAVRPASLTVCTSSGKGMTTAAALTSGAMEGIELFHAENLTLNEIYMPYNELRKEYNVIPVENLPLTKNSLFNESLPEAWALGWDIINQCETAVPLLSVTMGRSHLNPSEIVSFQMGSNGLSSGNNFLEALLSGILEVIERDAIACRTVANRLRGVPLRRVRLETIKSPKALELLDKLNKAQVMPIIYDFTVDTEIPVYETCLFDLLTRNVGIAKGMGAHLDPEIAMIRAITEAAQSRLLYIAGSRDDIFKSDSSGFRISDTHQAIEHFDTVPPTIDARQTKSTTSNSFENDISLCLDKIKQVGLNQVIVLDITKDEFKDISVIRVVIPGLEGYMFYHYTPGQRALNFNE
ncbi:YcaO-like domain protein [Candidatus Magnetoovum chiemensis]|nr:YcaO-like domain protein [Candidatus Magnetoovum chiemensis]